MHYIFSSAVITTPGTYEYKHLTLADATAWLKASTFSSVIGYRETAAALSSLTGITIPFYRRVQTMQPGDVALVFRLAFAPAAARPYLERLRPIDVEFIREHCEIGLLTRTT